MSKPKIGPKRRRTNPAAKKKTQRPEPEVVFSDGELEYEFRHQLDDDDTLEEVQADYRNWARLT